MLAIRLQRKGRKDDPFYRIIVQEARRHPSSGRLVRQIGTFNPHTKETNLDKDNAKYFLEHGAQPSNRVATLLRSEGIKLPSWVTIEKNEKRAIRNPEKLRRNQPAEQPAKEEVKDEPKAEAQKPTQEQADENADNKESEDKSAAANQDSEAQSEK